MESDILVALKMLDILKESILAFQFFLLNQEGQGY